MSTGCTTIARRAIWKRIMGREIIDGLGRAGRANALITPPRQPLSTTGKGALAAMLQPSSGIAPLETRYAGYRFRSRIEARWAVFFTRLGLDWEYEEQGFKVHWAGDPVARTSGSVDAWPDVQHPPGYVEKTQPTRYLPDFQLPGLGLYLEVKPAMPHLIDPEGVKRWQRFAGEVALEWDRGRTAMLCGPIPNPDTVDEYGPPRPYEWYEQTVVMLGDWHAAWCSCPSGDHFDIQFQGRGGRIQCGCPRILDDHYRTGNDPRILNAYAAARSARFEHGERA
jgi:hypothetical protein